MNITRSIIFGSSGLLPGAGCRISEVEVKVEVATFGAGEQSFQRNSKRFYVLIGEVLLCLRTNFQLDSTADDPGMLERRSEVEEVLEEVFLKEISFFTCR